ncbi:MAG: Kelch repeat-containing protein [Opitutales bacterium]
MARYISLFLIAASLLLGSEWELLETTGKPVKRNESSLTEVDGLFYLIGGRGMPPVSIYDPEKNTWRNASKPPIEIHHLQPVVYEGKIYILGAMTGRFPREPGVDKILIYDPKEDSWEWGPDIPKDRVRGAAGVVIVDEQIYLVGGTTGGHWNGYTNWLDRYDLKTGKWTQLADAPHKRDHFQAAYLDGKIYAAGGRRTSQETKEVFQLTVPEVDVYDIKTNTWSTLQEPLPTPRAGSMSLTVDKEIVVLGGESARKKAHKEVEAWNTEKELWHSYPPMQQSRHGTGAVLHNDCIYTCAGTLNRGGKPNLDTTERLKLK